jgi:hypothetical protein
MGRVKFQVTTRSGPAGSTPTVVVQADGEGRPGQIASRKMANIVGQLIEAAAAAADQQLVTEVAVLLYPADLEPFQIADRHLQRPAPRLVRPR